MLEYCCQVWHASLTELQKAVIEVLQETSLSWRLATNRTIMSWVPASWTLDRDSMNNFVKTLHNHFQPWLPEKQSLCRQLHHSDRFCVMKWRNECSWKSGMPYIIRLLNNDMNAILAWFIWCFVKTMLSDHVHMFLVIMLLLLCLYVGYAMIIISFFIL